MASLKAKLAQKETESHPTAPTSMDTRETLLFAPQKIERSPKNVSFGVAAVSANPLGLIKAAGNPVDVAPIMWNTECDVSLGIFADDSHDIGSDRVPDQHCGESSALPSL